MPIYNVKSDEKSFDEATVEAVWQRGKPEPGYSSETYRKDVCGA